MGYYFTRKTVYIYIYKIQEIKQEKFLITAVSSYESSDNITKKAAIHNIKIECHMIFWTNKGDLEYYTIIIGEYT